MGKHFKPLFSLLIAGLLGSLIWYGPSHVARWRADRTAWRLVEAMHSADSVRLTQLSASGSARNLLCARRLWPWPFWMRKDGSALTPERSRPYGRQYGYRTVGDVLPTVQSRAVFEFYIAPEDPTKVVSFFGDARTGVWNDTVRACMARERPNPRMQPTARQGSRHPSM
jgi:hypothetical protein